MKILIVVFALVTLLAIVTASISTFSVQTLSQVVGPSKVATRPSAQPIETASYFSLRNSTRFLVDKTKSTGIPYWEVRVWVEASLEHLSQIKYVIYHTIVVPSGARDDLQPIRCCPANKFLLTIGNVVGTFPLTATLYFNDGNHIDLAPLNLKLIIPRGYEDLALIHLNIEPKMTSSSNVMINGEARARAGHITKIDVDWGDGSSHSIGNKFPFSFSHSYSKTSAYTIKVAAYSSFGLYASQSVQTQTLLLQRSFPKDSSIGAKGIFVVNASISLSSIPEDSSTPFTVWGTLSYSTNGSGIRNQPISIIFLDNANNPSYRTLPIYTNANGNYSYSYPNLNFLSHGQYKVFVQVPGHKGLNATRDLIMLSHPLTNDQLITYLGTGVAVAVGIVGAITKVPNYFISRKHANYLSMYMQQINKKYNEFNNDGNRIHNKRQYIDNLEDIRGNITYLLQARDINDNQFKMLDDKISDCQQKISNAQ